MMYQTQTQPAVHAPTNPKGVRKHLCAAHRTTGCVNPVWSHAEPSVRLQHWQFCDSCYSRMPAVYTVAPVEDVNGGRFGDDDERSVQGGATTVEWWG